MLKFQTHLNILNTLLLIFVATILLFPIEANAEIIIGVVDYERALKECVQGKKAGLELKHRADKLEGELKGMNDEIQSLRKEFENSAMLLKPEAKLAKERDFERKVRILNDRTRDAQQEMQEAQRDAFQPLLREMGKIINELGIKGGYVLIIEARTTLYYPKNADITSQIITAYDKLHP